MRSTSSSLIEEFVPVQNESDIVQVQDEASRVAFLAGFPELAQWAFSTVASEAALNALKRGGSLRMRLYLDEDGCLGFEAMDQAPESSSRIKAMDGASGSLDLGQGSSILSTLMNSLFITSN